MNALDECKKKRTKLIIGWIRRNKKKWVQKNAPKWNDAIYSFSVSFNTQKTCLFWLWHHRNRRLNLARWLARTSDLPKSVIYFNHLHKLQEASKQNVYSGRERARNDYHCLIVSFFLSLCTLLFDFFRLLVAYILVLWKRSMANKYINTDKRNTQWHESNMWIAV